MATKSKRSSSSMFKRISRNNISNFKKDRLSVSSRERRSTAQSVEETFKTIFQTFCMQFHAWIVPDVEVMLYEPLPGEFPQLPSEISQAGNQLDAEKSERKQYTTSPAVIIIFDNYDAQTVLTTVKFKNFSVDRGMLIALRKSLQKFEILGTLKLEFCKLENTHLRTLKTILERNELITDLSIDGNPNRFQNFYILLKNTRIVNVSMRFCQINDRGVHLIALQLNSVFRQPLSTLNLSSNFISDNGALLLANALRMNRTLLSLNLADNWLTDIGCIKLMEILKKFPLQHEEIVLRRHRIMDFLRKKTEMIQQKKIELLQRADSESIEGYIRNLSKNSAAKVGNSSAKRSSKGRSSVTSSNKKEAASIQVKNALELDVQHIQEMIESELSPDDHPFVRDSYPENKKIYCKGNFKITHINLAYNKITIRGLQEITEVLKEQQAAGLNTLEGLCHVTIEGNLTSNCFNEICSINELIGESYSRRFSIGNGSRHSSRRKRSGLSRVSIN